MARYGYGISVSGSRKSIVASSGGAAPSGIVAATAGNLNISFGYFDPETYIKLTDTEWKFEFGEGEFQRLSYNIFSALAWTLDENNGSSFVATNPSVNPLIIPTTGWTYTVGSGPAVTITAA